MNGETTKYINRRQVLRLLSREPGISRTEIAARMGLVKMTVSNIIAEMLQSGMVIETKATGAEKTGAGRKLTGLRFSENAPVLAGVLLEGQKLHIGIFSMELQLLKRGEYSAKTDGASEQIASEISALLKNTGRSLLGTGLALGPGWDTSLGVLLQEKLNTPVFVSSSVAANTYAADRFTDYQKTLCLSLAPTGPAPAFDGGVRAAAMTDGVLLGDKTGCIPLGQMTRNGCYLAEMVSIPAICRQVSNALGIECRDLSEVQNACRENAAGSAVLCDIFSSLMDTVCNLCLTIRPEALMLDDALSGFGKELMDYFFSRLHARLGESVPVILNPVCGKDTSLFGAACFVLTKVFNDALGYDIFFSE